MSLQQRFQDPETPLERAAEGLSEEQRMFVKERELTEQIDQLTEERDALRKDLIAHYRETGDDCSNGAYKLAPYPVVTMKYDEKRFKDRFPEWYPKCLSFDSKLVKKMEEAKLLETVDLDDVRTPQESWRFHATKEKP